MKKLSSILIIILFLVGCSKPVEEEQTSIVVVDTDTTSYDYVLPFEPSSLRFSHSGHDYVEIGKGLLEISKEYFSTSDYNAKEGQVLKSYKDDFRPLVQLRESPDNPYGLNPEGSTSVKVNPDTSVTGPFLVSDIYEVNFTSRKNNEDLKGISLALVLNRTIEDDEGRQVTVSDEFLYKFATETAARKLESYISKKTELHNVPVVIGIYVTDSANNSIPGNYIAQAQFVNGQGQFNPIHQEWGIFPTGQGFDIDGKINEQIQGIKRSISGFIPEDVGVVAYGEFIDNQLRQLNISINVQTKTYTEISALSHYVGELIKTIDTPAPIRVEVKSMNELLAVIIRPANSSSIEVIMM